MPLSFLPDLKLGRWRVRLGLLAAGLCLAAAAAVCVVSYSNTITPEGVIIHHAALPSVFEGEPLDAGVIDRIHARRGYGAFYWGRFYHAGYHFIILPDGTVQQGRPVRCRGAHAAGYNSFVGVCLVGNFSTKDNPDGARGLTEPTEAQLRALSGLVLRLHEGEGIPLSQIRRHADVSPATECPGDRFPLEKLLALLPADAARSK